MRRIRVLALVTMAVIAVSCGNNDRTSMADMHENDISPAVATSTSLIVLGTVQDAGSPHIGCTRECCRELFDNPDPDRMVVSLGLYDAETGKKYLFEATPDMTSQMKRLKRFAQGTTTEMADGIFITHAHIGHYPGLMYLGREGANTKNVPVYVMPRMQSFLSDNAPWNLLLQNGNITPVSLADNTPVRLSDNLVVTPILVPHRDELSETVGFIIEGPEKKALFIPDIDKWNLWDRNIVEEIQKVDYAFLDATFFSGDEINRTDISEIPHPFIIESMELFDGLSREERSKIHFIHFNHTNPLLNPDSGEAKMVIAEGFGIAVTGQVVEL